MPRYPQARVEALGADLGDDRAQGREALQRVVLRLDRDDDPVRGDQRVDGEQAERGWAVDEDVVVLLLGPAVDDLAQGLLAADDREELVLRGRKVDVRRGHVHAVRVRADDDVLQRERRIQQDVGDGDLDPPWLDAEAHGQIGLGVHVHAEHAVTELGEGTGQVDGRRGLAHPALLVRDRDDACHRALRVCHLGPPLSVCGHCSLPVGLHGRLPAMVVHDRGVPSTRRCG